MIVDVIYDKGCLGLRLVALPKQGIGGVSIVERVGIIVSTVSHRPEFESLSTWTRRRESTLLRSVKMPFANIPRSISSISKHSAERG